MRFSQKIRKIWHDIYYNFVSIKGVEFALHCKDVTHQVDLSNAKLSLIKRLRVYLHLSLCQACHNYYSFTKFLNSKIIKISKSKLNFEQIKKLNEKLLKQYQNKH